MTDKCETIPCAGRLQRIEDMMGQVHDVLLVGNGKPPLLTQVANNRLIAWAGLWLCGVIIVAVVSGFVALLSK